VNAPRASVETKAGLTPLRAGTARLLAGHFQPSQHRPEESRKNKAHNAPAALREGGILDLRQREPAGLLLRPGLPAALRVDPELQMHDLIRRRLDLPLEKRLNFLRRRLPGGGSCL
jgi:hypothetical protein